MRSDVMKERRRIGLYGGTFDPVHNGHLQIARRVSELFSFDETIFIPAHVAPHKRDEPPTGAFHRHAMLALATVNEPKFFVSRLELEAPERPFTVETLVKLHVDYGDTASLFFIMGADSWLDITTWREWQRVLGLAHTIVVTRPAYEIASGHVTERERAQIVDLRGAERERVEQSVRASEQEGGDLRMKIFFTDAVLLDVSSTEIRSTLARETSARNESELSGAADQLIPESVDAYIRKYGLYKEQEHERKRRNARHDL